MIARAPSSSGASVEDFDGEALISEAVRRGLIAARIEDWSPRARRVLASLEWTKATRPNRAPMHPFCMADPDSR